MLSRGRESAERISGPSDRWVERSFVSPPSGVRETDFSREGEGANERPDSADVPSDPEGDSFVVLLGIDPVALEAKLNAKGRDVEEPAVQLELAVHHRVGFARSRSLHHPSIWDCERTLRDLTPKALSLRKIAILLCRDDWLLGQEPLARNPRWRAGRETSGRRRDDDEWEKWSERVCREERSPCAFRDRRMQPHLGRRHKRRNQDGPVPRRVAQDRVDLHEDGARLDRRWWVSGCRRAGDDAGGLGERLDRSRVRSDPPHRLLRPREDSGSELRRRSLWRRRAIGNSGSCSRSEERRVGKECRSR